MHSQAFLDLLDQQGILSPMDIESLREQVVAADSPIHPVFVARRLVTAGYLNPYHAKTLLSELAQAVRDAAQADPSLADTAEESPSSDLEDTLEAFADLELAPIETKDLLSCPEEAIPMLPSARLRGPLAWGRSGKSLNLGAARYERYLLPACFLLMGIGLLWLVFLMLRAVGS
ncbi:MAG: hypothetical protein GTO03_09860 [Planctomycetales bacterium]|nr:hypothetical protein [Planctomycetales bacterium]